MLVNNAGQGRVSTFADTADEAWREELELKYFSIIRPTRAFLPMLREAKAPSIVCVNSLLALQPEPHMVATSSARAGTLSLVKSLAGELAPERIRVNSILIGIVESGQWRRRFEAQAQTGPELGRLDRRTRAQQKHSARPLRTSRRSGAGALFPGHDPVVVHDRVAISMSLEAYARHV